MSENKKGVVALVVLAFVFATMGIFARYLATSFELFEQTYLRIGLAFLLACVVFSRDISWSKYKNLSKNDLGVLIFRSITLYLGVTLFTEALLNTKYGNASFIAALPLLPIMGYFLLGERLKTKTVLYVCIGFVGVLLISLVNFSTFKIGYGEVMALLSMLAFDFSYIARKWHSDYLNNKESTTFMFFAGAIFLFITSLVLGEPTPTLDQFTPFILLALFAGAIFNVANLFLTNYGFQRLKVIVAANILTLETIFALLYSVFLFKEAPLLRELIGGALVLISVYLVNRSETTELI